MSNSPECQHPIEKSRFLTTYETVHLDKSETHAMLACIFLCTECGIIYATNLEVLRGFLPNGDVPPEMLKIINKRKTDIQIEQKAHLLAAQLMKDQQNKKEPVK